MQLSKNFTLSELTKSQTALRLGIDNSPSSQQIFHLQNLCEMFYKKLGTGLKNQLLLVQDLDQLNFVMLLVVRRNHNIQKVKLPTLRY